MSNIEYTDKLTGQEYKNLRTAVNWGIITDKQAERAVAHTTFIETARIDGKAIAMGRIMFDFGYTAYIGDIIVDPKYQGQGIGRVIVEKLMNKVVQSADKGDFIMFVLSAAKGKEGFYEKLGFEVRPSETNGAGMVKRVIA